MKKMISFILATVMSISLLPSGVLAAEAASEKVLLDRKDHVEIEGADPVYPSAPEGFESYDDYRDNTKYVHDTEFYYDQEEKLWYYYITNSSEIWSSDNLVNWTKEETNRTGHAWAPCIIKLREPVEFEGETYTYALWDSLSTFGTRESWIRLWLSNSPKEGFVYAGDTVTSLLNDGKVHNAIDPSVFYDKEDTMWMVYGSFFGGMFLIELDQETLMPADPDAIPGERVVYRSKYLNSIEGPTIIYNPDTDYYYMNVSYGSLDHTYNVRIGRSKNVEGPYYDYNGMPLNNEGYTEAQTNQIGTKITTPYCFDSDKGWYSTAHSSFLYNPDTGEYFLSHNARQETVHGTRLNIRKLYWTEDGWPVVSPELYTEGEKEQPIPTRCIPGTYEFIELLRDDLSIDPMSAVKRGSNKIHLHEDHTITGAYEGNWIQTDENTLKLSLGDTVYTVTVSAAWDWENWKECLVFTGLSEAADSEEEVFANPRCGLGIWGKKIENETKILAEFTFDDLKTGFISENGAAEGSYSLKEHDGGHAVYLDGTSDFLEVTANDDSPLLTGEKDFTISMQLKPEDGANWVFYAAPNADPQPFLNERYLGVIDRGDTIAAERYDNEGERPRVAIGEKATDEWYHLTVVFEANETVIYVNGEEIARQSSDYLPGDVLGKDSILYIGKANWNEGEYYKGLIDNYRIIGNTLSPEEVKAAYMADMMPYKDVEPLAWYYDAVYNNYIAGTMTGKSKDTFAPDETLKRGQFASIMHRMAGEQEVVFTPEFPDVTEEDWFASAVLWAKGAGVVNGYKSGDFGPNDNIVREQMAVMMYNYAVFKGYDITAADDLTAFEDTDLVSEYALPAMKWAVGAGIISGKAGVRLDPLAETSRAECAAIVQNFMECYEQ